MTVDLNQYEFGPIKKKRHSIYWRMSIFLSCLKISASVAPNARRLDRYNASIKLDIETPLNGQDVILVACDRVYFFDYAIPFLRSLSSIEDNFHVHLHLINPDSEVEQHIEQLRTELANIKISYGKDQLTGLDLPKRLNIYYNCARFIGADHLFELGARRLLILDVDTIVRSSPWKKFVGFGAEGAFVFRPNAGKPWYKILANTVYLENSAQIRLFSRRYATALLDILAKNPGYHIDQITPHYLLKIGRRRFASVFAPVPKDVMSLSFDPSASLWTAKGSSKRETQFQMEINNINENYRPGVGDTLEDA